MAFLIKPEIEELMVLSERQDIIDFLTPLCYNGLYQYMIPARYQPEFVTTLATEMAEEITKHIPEVAINDTDFDATVERNPVEMQRHALQHICRGSVSWALTHGSMANSNVPGSIRKNLTEVLQLLLATALQSFLHPSILKAFDPATGYVRPSFTNLT